MPTTVSTRSVPDIYQLCSSLPKFEDWKCKRKTCKYRCPKGTYYKKRIQKAICEFDNTNGVWSWTGTPNPYCIIEPNLPEEQRFQPPLNTASPADYINCPKMFSQQDWTCKGTVYTIEYLQ